MTMRPITLATAAVAGALTLAATPATQAEPTATWTQSGVVPAAASGGVVLGDEVFFSYDDGVHGGELWKTDGTTAGTVMVKDLNPAGTPTEWYPYIPEPRELTVVGDELYFRTADADGFGLFKTDGTSAGTVAVSDDRWSGGSCARDDCIVPYPRGLTTAGGLVFFTAWHGADQGEIWRTDGTDAGTFMTKAVNANWLEPDVGMPSRSPDPLAVPLGDDHVMFSAYPDSTSPSEVWISDGTTAETVRLDDNDEPFTPKVLADLDGQLWLTDGTRGGSSLVKDIDPEPSSVFDDDITVDLGGTTILFAHEAAHGTELWRTDGTGSGTVLLKDLVPGAASFFSPGDIAVLGGAAYFTKDDGTELWRTDGTAAGTRLLRSFPAGASCSLCGAAFQLTPFGGRMFFRAPEGGGAWALWSSNGTTDGTVRVDQAGPGTPMTDVLGILDVDGRLAIVRKGTTVRRSTLWFREAATPMCEGKVATTVGSGSIAGTPGDDVIVGSAGVDTINGRGGNDTICAGDGDDLILGGTTSDGGDRVLGEGGLDTISYASRTGNVKVDLTTQAMVAGQAGEGDSLLGIENATGGAGNDDLIGNRYRNTLSGGAGNDVLSGAGGIDKEYGGAGDDAFWSGNVNGADLHNGQAGVDTINYSARTTSVVATLGGPAGNDGAPGEGDTLTLIENITSGAGNDTLTGNTSANRFRGGPGNDVLRLRDGITGNDTADGGTGTDTATYDPGDTLIDIP